MRRSLLAVTALVAVAACDCGVGSPKKQPDPRLGSACTRQADCGASLLCFAGTCEASLPAAASCASPGAAPTLVAGTAVALAQPAAGQECAFAVRTPVYAAGAGLGQVQDLGVHTVGDVLDFTVPAGTWSITIFEQAAGGTLPPAAVTYQGSQVTNAAVPTDVKTPAGVVLFTDTPANVPVDGNGNDVYTGFLSVHFGAAAPYGGTATFPNATKGLELARVAGELPAGTWTLRVNDWAYECEQLFAGTCTGGSTTSQYRVHVVTKGPPRGTGQLDLDVYLATSLPNGNPRLTAAQAVNDAGMKRLFSSTAAYLGGAGLCLGTVTFHDLPDWARARFESLLYDESTACDESAQIFQLSLTADSSVHLFFVDELVAAQAGTPGTSLLGLDGAIPGPSGLPGAPSSGAIVPVGGVSGCSGGIDIVGCEADLMAYVTAHETGHWLGLFHTTEQPGIFFDPLTDTGECPCQKCVRTSDRASCGNDPNLVVSTSQCVASTACAGGDNLMFWLVSGSQSKGRLSSQQGEVVRLNPAVEE